MGLKEGGDITGFGHVGKQEEPRDKLGK